MLSSMDLCGVWKLKGFDPEHGRPGFYCVDEIDESTFLDGCVPGEVHLDLQRAGLIEDPNLGLGTLRARWVEEQVWVYRRTFDAPAEAIGRTAWIVFDGLDTNAAVFLNGEELGTHDSAFTPFRVDVTGKLRAGSNSLAVRLESGLFGVSEKSGEGYNPALDHRLHKRAWLRKPQYSFGWDWNPRLINVGIWKGVRLQWSDAPRMEALSVLTHLTDDHKSASIEVRAFVENPAREAVTGVLRVTVPEAGVSSECEITMEAGVSRQTVTAEIPGPRLWWPRPHGDQPLYTVQCEVMVDGEVVDRAQRRTGIRSIRINQDPHPVKGEYFILEVNGRSIFARGGNWVPPDMIYARPDAAHYRKLVGLAVDANFNALRIWGGGLFADHALLDACDEMGVLVWHDFLFACSKYPADDAEFLANVRREVTFGVRDLSHHPSLLVWCGNNELEWAAWSWGYDRAKAHPDYALYHLEIPRIMREEDPSRPYWPSSPYSTDHRHPQDPTTGDQHPWHVSLGSGGPDFWEYRKDPSRFPNEGGVLGASCPETLNQFLPENQRRLFSPAWDHHDNSCNFWQVNGIAYQVFEHWTGRRPADVTFEDYVFYSSVLQAEGLQEYIQNYRRRMYSSSSAIFWMYNDSWPVSHGWTIVDYYLRRKACYHPVRRAFAPLHVIVAVEDDRVMVFGVNEFPHEWKGQLRWGLFSLAGGFPEDTTTDETLPPNASTLLAEMPLSRWSEIGADTTGAFAALYANGQCAAQSRLFIAKFSELKWAAPDVKVERRGRKAVFTSPVFAWGVTLDVDPLAPVSDDCFDVLPGIAYEIDWPEDRPLPAIRRVASDWKL